MKIWICWTRFGCGAIYLVWFGNGYPLQMKGECVNHHGLNMSLDDMGKETD